MKIYNYLNGAFFVLYGLFGALLPLKMAAIMGWDPSLLGMHQIRAICMAMMAAGILLCLFISQNRDQRLITMSIIFVMLAFAAGRCLGLLLDGSGPMQTYYELGFEIFWAAVGWLLMSRQKTA